MKPTWNVLTEDEWQLIFRTRAEKMTGYVLHETLRGDFYIWPWGRQPDGAELWQISRPTIGEAVEAFLRLYHRRPREFHSDFAQPRRRLK